jgi:hypothetical protein
MVETTQDKPSFLQQLQSFLKKINFSWLCPIFYRSILILFNNPNSIWFSLACNKETIRFHRLPAPLELVFSGLIWGTTTLLG